MSRPLGKIFTNNTVFFSESLCLIYFSTRPKLPLLCAIFYISPTECKLLCWGKKTKTKTSSAGLGPYSGADVCEALVTAGVVGAFRRWQPCHRRRSALLTLQQNSGSRPNMASQARSRLVKETRKIQRDQFQNCSEIPLLNISETLFSAFRQISVSIYSPFPSLKWAPLDFLNFINLCRQWSLTRGLHSGRKQRKTTNNERGS